MSAKSPHLSHSPTLGELVKNADYDAFLAALKTKKLMKRLSKSKLTNYYYEFFQRDQENFNKVFKQIFDGSPNGLSSSHARSQRINRIIDLMQDGTGNKAFAAPETMSAYDCGDSGGFLNLACAQMAKVVAVAAVVL